MDEAQLVTDKALLTMEKRISAVYSKAESEVSEKLYDYMRRFEIKDEKKRIMLAKGEISKAEYITWRRGQIMVGKRWTDLREQIAVDYHNANVIARDIVKNGVSGIYALNHNYATYTVEKGSLLDTSYTLYSRSAVERILRDNPKMLPGPGRLLSQRIAEGKDVLWNRQQVQSTMLQGIIQGESIPKLAQRLAKDVGETNHKSALRAARTMSAGAMNGGRVDAYERAFDMGIEVLNTWVATLDSRTRDSHRHMDGETVWPGEPFSNGLKFPGDPDGAPEEVYNCRCTIIPQVKHYARSVRDLERNTKLGDMSYDEWLEEHGKSEPITRQEQISEILKGAYISEYKRA